MTFKQNYTFEDRIKESSRVLNKYPDRIPVICEKLEKNRSLQEIDKHKYLVPSDLTMGQFVYVIRKRLRLPAEKAIFLFVNGTISTNSARILEVYHKHRDKDGFLYIKYSDENTFGGPYYLQNMMKSTLQNEMDYEESFAYIHPD